MLFGCQSSSHTHETDLEKTIESKLSDKTATEIDLNEVTDFQWAKAYVFYPYTTDRMINDQLGFSYNDPSNIELRDDITLLILVDRENKVHYAEVERKNRDFLNGEKEGYTPNNAIIKITRNEGG